MARKEKDREEFAPAPFERFRSFGAPDEAENTQHTHRIAGDDISSRPFADSGTQRSETR